LERSYLDTVDTDLSPELQEQITEEKIVADILNREQSYILLQRALDNLRTITLKAIAKETRTTQEHLNFPPLEASALDSSAPILPHRDGGKSSILNILINGGLNDIPEGYKLSSMDGYSALSRIDQIRENVRQGLSVIAEKSGKQFPFSVTHLDPNKDILTVSVRSGSFLSMPGILNSILNLGLNDTVVDFMVSHHPDHEWTILDSYRRLLNYYAESVLCFHDKIFIDIIDQIKEEKGQPNMEISNFSSEDLKTVLREYKKVIYKVMTKIHELINLSKQGYIPPRKLFSLLRDISSYVDLGNLLADSEINGSLGDEERMRKALKKQLPFLELFFPVKSSDENTPLSFALDPFTMVVNSVVAVYRSWNQPAATLFREKMRIANEWGTGITIQEIAFGNSNQRTGTGVLFTHNPQTGELLTVPGGSFKRESQGPDIVGGRTSHVETWEVLKARDPQLFNLIMKKVNIILRIMRYPQDIEITVSQDNPQALPIVNVLQSRNMDIIHPKTLLSPNDGQLPVTRGRGETGNACWARFLLVNADTNTMLKRIQDLRQAMDKNGEKDIGIVLISYYLPPTEAVLLINDHVSGGIAIVPGQSAHALLVTRKNGKLLITGASGMDIENDNDLTLNGHKIKTGMEGGIYSLDANSDEISPNGGAIFEGKINITNINGTNVPSKAMNSDTDLPSLADKGGIDLRSDLYNLQVIKETDALPIYTKAPVMMNFNGFSVNILDIKRISNPQSEFNND
jgi:hypothetical protein